MGADVGGQRELVTPECGVLIARGNADDAPTEAERYADILAETPGRIPRPAHGSWARGSSPHSTRFSAGPNGTAHAWAVPRGKTLAR